MKDKQTIFFFIEKIHFSIFYFIFLFVQRKENILFVTHHLLLLTLELLLGQLLLWRLVISHLSDNLFFLRKNQLDVAWAWHIRVDATVSTVCTATQAWSTVDLHERKINKHMKMISWLCKMGFARRLVMWMWHKDIRHSSYWRKMLWSRTPPFISISAQITKHTQFNHSSLTIWPPTNCIIFMGTNNLLECGRWPNGQHPIPCSQRWIRRSSKVAEGNLPTSLANDPGWCWIV